MSSLEENNFRVIKLQNRIPVGWYFVVLLTAALPFILDLFLHFVFGSGYGRTSKNGSGQGVVSYVVAAIVVVLSSSVFFHILYLLFFRRFYAGPNGLTKCRFFRTYKEVKWDDLSHWCIVGSIRSVISVFHANSQTHIILPLNAQTCKVVLEYAGIDLLSEYEVVRKSRVKRGIVGIVLCLVLSFGFLYVFLSRFSDVFLLAGALEGNVNLVRGSVFLGGDLNRLLVPPNESEGKITPLIIATSAGRINVVKYILERDVNVNTVDKIYGRSALFYAAKNGNVELLKLLLIYGADPRIQDISGRFPMDYAKEARCELCVEELARVLPE